MHSANFCYSVILISTLRSDLTQTFLLMLFCFSCELFTLTVFVNCQTFSVYKIKTWIILCSKTKTFILFASSIKLQTYTDKIFYYFNMLIRDSNMKYFYGDAICTANQFVYRSATQFLCCSFFSEIDNETNKRIPLQL